MPQTEITQPKYRRDGLKYASVTTNEEWALIVPFIPAPDRWVFERTFAWLNRNRRLAKDVDASIASAECWSMIASVKLLSRRLAKA